MASGYAIWCKHDADSNDAYSANFDPVLHTHVYVVEIPIGEITELAVSVIAAPMCAKWNAYKCKYLFFNSFTDYRKKYLAWIKVCCEK